jgi:uncharacterized protein (TIGR00290 family)
MRYALSFSGGKDSMLALDRARRQGLDVACLFNIFEGSSGRVRFHGVRAELIQRQAGALGLPLIQASTHPDDYETVLLRILDQLRADGIGGIVFGNIHLSDIRAWYEERTIARGFQHVEPLWGNPGTQIVREVIDRGYRAHLVSIDLARTPRDWLGRPLDDAFLADLARHPDIDPCGERGEYHTFVSAGPLFFAPIALEFGSSIEMEGHALLELQPMTQPTPSRAASE